MKLPFKLDSLQALTGPSGGARLLTQGPLLVSVILAGAIAAQMAATAWKFLPGSTVPAAADAAAAAAVTRAAAVFDVNSILAAQLFGVAGAAGGDGADAPQTQMQLVLAGTIATSDPEHGFAILGESAQAARMYAVGANLPGGAKLHQVFNDRVILDRGGALESLLLPRQNLAGTAISQPPPAMPTADAESPEPSLANSVRRIIAQDPQVVGEVLRPQPVFDKGSLRGYRIYPGRDREKFARLGLQPGDLVTQINGNPLTDPSQGMQIMQGLGHGDRVTVTVERGGQSQQMVVDTAKIDSMAGGDAPPTP